MVSGLIYEMYDKRYKGRTLEIVGVLYEDYGGTWFHEGCICDKYIQCLYGNYRQFYYFYKYADGEESPVIPMGELKWGKDDSFYSYFKQTGIKTIRIGEADLSGKIIMKGEE